MKQLTTMSQSVNKLFTQNEIINYNNQLFTQPETIKINKYVTVTRKLIIKHEIIDNYITSSDLLDYPTLNNQLYHVYSTQNNQLHHSQ